MYVHPRVGVGPSRRGRERGRREPLGRLGPGSGPQQAWPSAFGLWPLGEPGQPPSPRGRGRRQGGAGRGAAAASPRLRGAREDAGQRGQRRGRLAGALESVDEDAGHEGPLQGGRRRAGPAVQVQGGAGVQVGNQTLRVEIRRREHPLQRRVVARLRQQLQPDGRLSLPFSPGDRNTRGVRAAAPGDPCPSECPAQSACGAATCCTRRPRAPPPPPKALCPRFAEKKTEAWALFPEGLAEGRSAGSKPGCLTPKPGPPLRGPQPGPLEPAVVALPPVPARPGGVRRARRPWRG